MSIPSQISILPATSASASRLVQLLQQQHPQIRLRLAARNPQKLPTQATIAVSQTPFDVNSSASLQDAFQGSEAAYVINPPFRTERDPRAASKAYSDNLVKAVNNTATLNKIVLLSSVGADKPSGTGPIGNVRIVQDALLANLRDAIQVIALRPPAFLANFKISLAHSLNPPHVFASEMPLHAPIHFINADTIAATALKYLTSTTDEPSTSPPNKGPLTAVQLITPTRSISEIAKTVGEILNVKLDTASIPEEVWVENLKKAGLYDEVIALAIEMRRAMATGHVGFLDQQHGVEEEHKRGVKVVTETPTFDLKPTLKEFINKLQTAQQDH